MAYFNMMMNEIYNMNMYIDNFNYVYMYNTIVNNIIMNNIPIDYFGFGHFQVNTLYNFLAPYVINNLNNNDILIPTIQEVINQE